MDVTDEIVVEQPQAASPEVTSENLEVSDGGTAMKKWKEEVQKRIESQKQIEAEALQAVTKQAKEELEKWRQSRKEKIEANSDHRKPNLQKAEAENTKAPFDWKKVADIISKSGDTPNDQNNGPSQKMVDLIFMKAKE